MNAEQQNIMREQASRIEALERLTRRIPSRFVGGGSSDPTALYRIIAGNVLPSIPGLGIARRTDTVLGSELPAGVGTGVVLVPANPGAVGLPNGVGVAQRVDDGSYVWVLNDATLATSTPDLQYGDIIEQATVKNLDKVVGADTYRYVCLQPISGWWG